MSMGQNGDEPTVGQLVANASKELSSLVRGEVELAKTELKKTAVAAGTGAGLFAAAAFLALLAVILLSIAAAYGLTAAGLHPAIAFLIVAGAFLLIGAILVFIGMRALKSAKGPERTIETSKESVEALKAIGKGDGEHAALPESGVRR
ncbi:phage holin family protein [Kribbella jiaozuonensis]|uniref:Phage holin family protein n=1 Tax=Kribbella jiaozuonensis TaxID=2575441 RepID=A0A4U3LZY9_9ACTN|nr:phage holin family protein [Kribbella jiaozuonensis]TKK81412.1 phage holin family protein [Kribbella jiaozuonensis]